ncbi:acetyltransferase [Streptomyces sp. NBC_00075]|uniref:GNAT family N-acetyltransferase n=1 Tax=Streptomyces sp. NBC_00075 TaxID=2975641 RepID=UPI00324FF5B6
MHLPPGTVPGPPAPAPELGEGWTLREIGPASAAGGCTRAYLACLAGLGGEAVLRLEISRVLCHPLRGCYPPGARDLALDIRIGEAGRSGQRLAPGFLRTLTPALFAADPRCRRVVAAPAVADTAVRQVFDAAGFRETGEADLLGHSVVLLVAEPTRIVSQSVALDDMPH